MANSKINSIPHSMRNMHGEYFEYYTVSYCTGLSEDTEVEYYRKVSRWAGTGYYDDVYRICGTDDAVVVRHGISLPEITLEKGYFRAQKKYGAACRAAAHKCHLPMEVALALGPDLCCEFAAEAAKVKYRKGGTAGSNKTGFAVVHPYQLDDGAIGELEAGIARRKKAISNLLADCSSSLQGKIERMGQINSERIARYLMTL